MKNTQPPKAIRVYMAEYEETEDDVREYIRRQLKYFDEIEEKADTTVEQWLGFKLGCTAGAAKAAIRWACVGTEHANSPGKAQERRMALTSPRQRQSHQRLRRALCGGPGGQPGMALR